GVPVGQRPRADGVGKGELDPQRPMPNGAGRFSRVFGDLRGLLRAAGQREPDGSGALEAPAVGGVLEGRSARIADDPRAIVPLLVEGDAAADDAPSEAVDRVTDR